MISVILCGYREWAINVFDTISNHSNINVIHRIESHEEYLGIENQMPDNVDVVVFLGWSWIIPEKITKKYLCLGVHPSDLPFYRGGSPIQNQIINGITKTKITLMTLSSDKIDAGDIWLKEDLDLSGYNISEIFKNIEISTVKLLNKFFNDFPDIVQVPQNIQKGSYFRRRKPDQSRISKADIQDLTLEEIYNFIRCLTDPYPNAYIEDEFGNRLEIKEVRYIKGNKAD